MTELGQVPNEEACKELAQEVVDSMDMDGVLDLLHQTLYNLYLEDSEAYDIAYALIHGEG